MKKIISIITAVFCMACMNMSCKKTSGEINPLSSVDNNGTGAYLILDSLINSNINSAQVAASTVSIAVHYYPGGQPVDHVILFASATPTFDTTQWHMIKSIPYKSPTTVLAVSGTELATALGVDPASFVPGSNYTIYTRAVTKSGQAFDVNDTGDNAGTGLISGSDYHSAFSFTAFIVCPFVAPMAGDYTITRDDWQDYVPLPVTITGAVTDGPGPNQLSLHIYPGPAAGIQTGPMIVDVDPATGTATIEPGTIGTYGGTITTVTGSGHVFSCTGVINLNVDFIIGGADQGSFTLIMNKN